MKFLTRFSRDRALLAGLGLAYSAFALTFRGPRRSFWDRMTLTGLTLGTLALKAEPDLRRTRVRPKDIAAGLASAGALYGIFQVGDRIARIALPRGGSEIEAIYDLRRLRPRPELAARLALVIGPAEELFWRGFVQSRLEREFGRVPGAIMGTAAYGGAHVVTGNTTLIGAATVAGGFWGALHAARIPLSALIVSHMAWDVVIFLIAPTVKQSAEGTTDQIPALPT